MALGAEPLRGYKSPQILLNLARGVIPAKAPFPFGAVLGGLSLLLEHELARQAPITGILIFSAAEKPINAARPATISPSLPVAASRTSRIQARPETKVMKEHDVMSWFEILRNLPARCLLSMRNGSRSLEADRMVLSFGEQRLSDYLSHRWTARQAVPDIEQTAGKAGCQNLRVPLNSMPKARNSGSMIRQALKHRLSAFQLRVGDIVDCCRRKRNPSVA